MAFREVSVSDYREAVVRLRAGESVRQVAKELGLARNTVRAYRKRAGELGLLDPEVALPDTDRLALLWKEERVGPPAKRSTVDVHRERVLKLLEKGVDATVVHRLLVEEEGFTGSYSSVQRFVRALRSSEPRVTVRVETPAGELAQVDFGFLGYLRADPEQPPRKSWLFVMVLAHSRHMYARIVQDQTAATWQDLHRRAFAFFGGVPRIVVPDNLKAAILKACFEDPQVQRSYRECAEHYGFRIRPARVRKPKDKPKVERSIQYVRRSFWKARDFDLLGDANASLLTWLVDVAGRRVHGTTQRRPLEVFERVERDELLALPERPWEPTEYRILKVHPDCHVQLARAYYSAPCRLVGKEVLVQATARQVVVWFDHVMVASHVRVGPGQRQTNPAHVPPHKVRFYTQSPDWCRERADRIGPHTREVIDDLLLERPVDKLRTAQGILALGERYGDDRLEAACRRGLHYGDVRRRTLKNILDRALDLAPLDAPRNRVLPFPRFTRDAAEIFGRGDP